ncbi:ciliary microtubule-associated protein 2-like [Hoplias malabaricus]|uniref:ciliary microtubule-associated protein 2-like n=1 Tax=Hoplias malabaricus TaxID=27720 RepID=UPI0034637922
MAEKNFKGAPFGSQLARFDVSGVHPANKRVGTYTQISYCKRRTTNLERNLGPGTYNPDIGDFSARAVQERAKGPGWKQAQLTARLAQLPHLLYRDAWENKQFLKTKVGPGTYRITSFTEELEKKPGSLRGICESREERFRNSKSETPGPGTYGTGGVLEERKRSVGTRSFMDSNTSLRRFPDSFVQDYTLSPCTYNLKSFPDLKVSRSVHKKGQTVTSTECKDGDDDGNFAPENEESLRPEDTENIPKFAEKKKHGVFSQFPRFPPVPTERHYLSSLAQCPRPETFPGPGCYQVTHGTIQGQSRRGIQAPFLSSAPRISKRSQKVLNQPHNPVGLAHNDIKISANGHSSSFLSGTKRYPLCPARDKFIQERLRPKNILPKIISGSTSGVL